MAITKVINLNSKRLLDRIVDRIFERAANSRMTQRDFYIVWNVILDRQLGAVKKRMALKEKMPGI